MAAGAEARYRRRRSARREARSRRWRRIAAVGGRAGVRARIRGALPHPAPHGSASRTRARRLPTLGFRSRSAIGPSSRSVIGIDKAAAAPDAPAILEQAVARSPRRARSGRRRPLRTGSGAPSPASSTSSRRARRARSNRMVSCGSQSRRALSLKRQVDVQLRDRPVRAIDLFGGRRRDRHRGTGRASIAHGEAVAARRCRRPC